MSSDTSGPRHGRKLKRGRIDAYWKGVLLIEHKSSGEDLERAFAQASDYFDGLPERDLPRYILVSDFAHFRLHELEADATIAFRLSELHQKVRHFGFIAGYRTQEIEPQNPVNIRAAHPNASLADLYDPLTMPPNLVKAHQALDAAVDGAYGRKNFKNDAERVAFLFELYQKYTSLLPTAAPATARRKQIGQTAG
jgi:hypothetical protein